MSLAWHTAVLSRQKRIPPLEKLLSKSTTAAKKKVPMTWQEQLAKVKEINAALGGRPIRKKRKR